MTDYESVLNGITDLTPATEPDLRDIWWTTPAQVVGVAKDPMGHLEIFLAGSALNIHSAIVDRAAQHHQWHRSNGASLSATRLMLPPLGYFDQVGAFLCTELLRKGADEDLPVAFALTEPIIELAIERLQLSESAMLGLAGELLLLEALCRNVDPQLLPQLLQGWDGWRRSHRDLRVGTTGVEVKTTTHMTSTHAIQGFHQIEPFPGDATMPAEDRLILVSIGLQPHSPSSGSFTIPQMVQRIVNRLAETGHKGQAAEFLRRVAIYGSESGFGYDHNTMAREAPFTDPYAISFIRAYDMADPAIDVLQSDDVIARHHVDPGSFRFTITLPMSLGSTNPVLGANQIAQDLLA